MGKKVSGMNVLSLFDGMSCGQIALNRCGIKVNNYFASEIDKYAIQVTQKNYPGTKQLGSVEFVNGSNLPKIDLLIGGSPCQGFSFAGKQLNFNDPRSMLFFEYVRLLKECDPKYFLLENVKMKKEHQSIISEHLKCDPIEINSALVSAQNRKRLYWTNIPNVNKPEDKNILLKDILEVSVEEKYLIKNHKNGFNALDVFKKGKALRVGGMCTQSDKHNYDLIKISKSGAIKQSQNKASCITSGGNSGGNHSDMDLLCIASRGRYNKDGSTSQNIEPRFDNKTNAITTVQKDNMIVQKPRGFNKGGLFKEKAPTISSNSWEHNNHIINDYIIRRLTPVECERLQTVPDNYTDSVSNTQRYKMLGNGFTVGVIAHILSFIKT